MSKFMVKLTAVNPKEEHRCTPPVEVMVDTGSELSWLPKQLLLDAGITPRGNAKVPGTQNLWCRITPNDTMGSVIICICQKSPGGAGSGGGKNFRTPATQAKAFVPLVAYYRTLLGLRRITLIRVHPAGARISRPLRNRPTQHPYGVAVSPQFTSARCSPNKRPIQTKKPDEAV